MSDDTEYTKIRIDGRFRSDLRESFILSGHLRYPSKRTSALINRFDDRSLPSNARGRVNTWRNFGIPRLEVARSRRPADAM